MKGERTWRSLLLAALRAQRVSPGSGAHDYMGDRLTHVPDLGQNLC